MVALEGAVHGPGHQPVERGLAARHDHAGQAVSEPGLGVVGVQVQQRGVNTVAGGGGISSLRRHEVCNTAPLQHRGQDGGEGCGHGAMVFTAVRGAADSPDNRDTDSRASVSERER